MSFRKIVRRTLRRCNAKVDNFCGIQDLMYTINDTMFISYIMFTVVSGSLFHSFITLCEKEYFLMSNLHCSLTNAAL